MLQVGVAVGTAITGIGELAVRLVDAGRADGVALSGRCVERTNRARLTVCSNQGAGGARVVAGTQAGGRNERAACAGGAATRGAGTGRAVRSKGRRVIRD